NNHTWHEADWEHVTLRLVQQGSTWVPDQINFYQHNGGHTRTPQQTWWSATNARSYGGIRQGYDATHTHLHLWIAADSHATYNRYDSVYHIEVSNLFGL